MIFVSNQLNFELKFITNEFWKIDGSKVAESFPIIFEVFRKHFPKSNHFWIILNLNDVTRRFCDVTDMTLAFYDSVSKIFFLEKFGEHQPAC